MSNNHLGIKVKSIPILGIDTHNLDSEKNEMYRDNILKLNHFSNFALHLLSNISSYRSFFLYYNKSQFEKSRKFL